MPGCGPEMLEVSRLNKSGRRQDGLLRWTMGRLRLAVASRLGVLERVLTVWSLVVGMLLFATMSAAGAGLGGAENRPRMTQQTRRAASEVPDHVRRSNGPAARDWISPFSVVSGMAVDQGRAIAKFLSASACSACICPPLPAPPPAHGPHSTRRTLAPAAWVCAGKSQGKALQRLRGRAFLA